MQDEVTCDKVGVCSLTGVPQEVPAIRLEEEMASPAAAVVRLRGSAAPFISLLLVKGAFVPGVSDATGKVYHSMLLSAINTFLPSFLPSSFVSRTKNVAETEEAERIAGWRSLGSDRTWFLKGGGCFVHRSYMLQLHLLDLI